MLSNNLTMANYLLLYLQEKGLPIDCDVYSLAGGLLFISEWGDNDAGPMNLLRSYLPAYYITNCSIPYLVELVQNLNISNISDTSWDFGLPYNERDNGDTFVALLFTISGSCVSCWMLTLLLYLLPKHKRKTWVAQFATIFYAIVTTILLSRITTASRIEYFLDTLDIIKLHDNLYNTNAYRITTIISQSLTHAAWFEIVLNITRDKYKWISGLFGGCLFIAYTIICMYYEIKYNATTSIFNSTLDMEYHSWRIVRVVLKLLFIAWLGGSLFVFTFITKNPKKICYSKKLFPLGLFNWVVIAGTVVLNVLALSLYRDVWLVKTWLEMLPYLLEIILITTLWEWIYNIGFLEKRYELLGMLGRRISVGDVESVHLGKRIERKRFGLFKREPEVNSDWLSKEITTSGTVEKVTSSKNEEEDHLMNNRQGSSEGGDSGVTEFDAAPNAVVNAANESNTVRSNTNLGSTTVVSDTIIGSNTNIGTNTVIGSNNIGTNTVIGSSVIVGSSRTESSSSRPIEPFSRTSSPQSFDDEYVDDYIWDDDPDDSDVVAPPPFQPHPGFSHDDYWSEAKR